MVGKNKHLKDILWFLVFLGLVAGIFRLWFGLGATTNLTDAMPWGLWKILNMIAGVAVSTGGFMVGFLVYVLKLKRFKPLVKPAILIAFLGYGASCTALLFDIGLPQRFWHPIVMWNEHSFLFEVFWCVLLYFTVTFIELSPTIGERFHLKKMADFLHRIAFGVVVVGISLSSLHHSSLGSLFLVTPLRLHPLWYSSLLPLFFIISAMGAGMMFVVLVKILYSRWYDPESVFGSAQGCLTCSGADGSEGQPVTGGRDMPSLRSLAAIASVLLGAYLLIKLVDLAVSGKWRVLITGSWESWLYGTELLISTVIPILLVLLPKTRRSPTGLGLASFSAVAGLALNRLDVGIFGYFHDAQTVYFPSLAEWALSLGVVAAAGLVFLFTCENFAIFDDSWKERTIARGMFRSGFDSLSHVWNTALSSGLERATLIAVFAVPLAWIAMYPPYFPTTARETVRPAKGMDEMRTMLRIDGNREGLDTAFPHLEHQNRLGAESSCVNCHHLSMPGDNNTPCSRCHQHMFDPALIFDHSNHMIAVARQEKLAGLHPPNQSCSICHTGNLAKSAANAKGCLDCHGEDMHPGGNETLRANWMRAGSYQQAMHDTCGKCHKREAEKPNHPALSECYTCHESLKPRDGTIKSVFVSANDQEAGGIPAAHTP